MTVFDAHAPHKDVSPGTVTRIMVPLSGAPGDERALPVAHALAHRLGLPITLMSAISDQILEDRLHRYLDGIGERLDDVDASTEVIVGDGRPAEVIVRSCDEHTLPVMATSGHLLVHERYLGSAAAWVVRESGRPVVLAGGHCNSEMAFAVTRVVVPIDGSITSTMAVPLGAEWARKLDVPLWLITVMSPAADREALLVSRHEAACAESNHLHAIAKETTRSFPDVDVEWDVFHHKNAGQGIATAAGPDGLICMTTHGRTGLASVAMGSVARKTVREAQQPVILQRPDDLRNG